MVATQGVFAAENKAFNLYDLIRDFKAQHDEHCHRMGIAIKNEISVSLMKQNTKRPFQHYCISCGEDYTDSLINFFKKHGLTIHNSTKNRFYLNKAELQASGLTYKDAHDFLFDLHQAIQCDETRQSCSETVTNLAISTQV